MWREAYYRRTIVKNPDRELLRKLCNRALSDYLASCPPVVTEQTITEAMIEPVKAYLFAEIEDHAERERLWSMMPDLVPEVFRKAIIRGDIAVLARVRPN